MLLVSIKSKADLKRRFEAEAKSEFTSLLSEINGAPSAAQKALAEQAAYVIARSRQLRFQDRHREAEACAKLLASLLGQLGLLKTRSKPKAPLSG